MLALLVVGVFGAILYRSWVEAQGDGIVVFASVARAPVVTWAVEQLTDDPELEDIDLAGSPTTVARPGGKGPWPAIVFLNGATRRGRFHPRVRDAAGGLARAGYLVFVPDLPGVRFGEITTRTLDGAVLAVREAQRQPDVRGGRVALYGVSTGATLALLVAEDARVAQAVSIVAGIAPYTDLRDVVRLASTGYHLDRGKLELYDAEPYVSLAVARSLAAALPRGRDRHLLLRRLLTVADDEPDPLAGLRAPWVEKLGKSAQTLVKLLLNTDPQRFERLFSDLPAAMKKDTRRLSPISGAAALCAPVEIATAPHDKYFPTAESRALQRAVPTVRVTVTSTLGHAIPEPSLGSLGDLAAFDAFLVRALHGAQ